MQKIIFLILLSVFGVKAQSPDWKLKLSSNVELRTWKLTSKADKEQKGLAGATVKLLKGSTEVNTTTTDANGDFVVEVPPNGDFILEVSYPSCNSKRISVSTYGVPDDFNKDNFKPGFDIGGFIMAKPFPGIDYSGLQQPLVKVVYFSKGKKFDHDDDVTNQGLSRVAKINADENALIEKFCSTNKAGDVALAKPDCPLAETLYQKAISILSNESYPTEQLKKVGKCLKDKEEADKKAAEATAAKAEADKLAKEKVEADKIAKEKAAAEKAEADKLAKQKTADEKLAAQKSLAEKKEAERIAKEKAAAEQQAKLNVQAKATATVKAEVKTKPKEMPAETKKPVKQPAVAESKPIPKETTTSVKTESADKGDSRYRIPQALGTNQYKDAVNKAEGYFKMKRWTEAKKAYEDVLKIKPGDAYATAKLAEVEKALAPK